MPKRHLALDAGSIFFILFLAFFLESPFVFSMHSKDAKPQHYFFRYEVNVPSFKKEGQDLKLWVPYPSENDVQKIKRMDFITDAKTIVQVTREKRFGNKMIFVNYKTQKKPIHFSFEYTLERSVDDGTQKKMDPFLAPSLYRASDTLVPVSLEIKKIALEEGKYFKKPSQKVRAFYEYIVRTMTYDKKGEGWGRGDAVWACSTKRGNCTDFHSLFIALNRSQKIPARFEIGFPIPEDKIEGEILGYHCWAQAFAQDKGAWIPVDASEAKKTGKSEDYFGKLPANRIEFSRGRDIILNPPQKGDPLNFFIYPYIEIDGKPFLDLTQKFSFKRLS